MDWTSIVKTIAPWIKYNELLLIGTEPRCHNQLIFQGRDSGVLWPSSQLLPLAARSAAGASDAIAAASRLSRRTSSGADIRRVADASSSRLRAPTARRIASMAARTASGQIRPIALGHRCASAAQAHTRTRRDISSAASRCASAGQASMRSCSTWVSGLLEQRSTERTTTVTTSQGIAAGLPARSSSATAGTPRFSSVARCVARPPRSRKRSAYPKPPCSISSLSAGN